MKKWEVTPQTAAVLVAVIVALTVAYVWGPESSHDELVTGIGAAGAVVLAIMKQLAVQRSE